jgi:hypothetical protein
LILHFKVLKKLRFHINAPPTNAGIPRLIIHKISEAEIIDTLSPHSKLKKKTDDAPRTVISVRANVGMADVTKKIIAINKKQLIIPKSTPKVNNIK